MPRGNAGSSTTFLCVFLNQLVRMCTSVFAGVSAIDLACVLYITKYHRAVNELVTLLHTKEEVALARSEALATQPRLPATKRGRFDPRVKNATKNTNIAEYICVSRQ